MPGCDENLELSRRALLGGAASLSLWGLLPRSAQAGMRDPRLLTVILRGGLDGLSLASPAGDAELVRVRGRSAVTASGEGAGLPLDGFFVLNPAMPFLHGLYRKREALIVHAVASPYRDRSHFDGQDVLESGLAGVGRSDTGWLNRALAEIRAGASANPAGLASSGGAKALALGAVVPLVMRGPAPVLSWIPQTFRTPLRESTIARLADLYAHTDPALAKALAEGIALDTVGIAGAGMKGPGQPGGAMREFVETAEAAARFLGSADGPRIGVLSFNGWDTHANAGVLKGALANRLGGLDAALKAFSERIGPAWKDTVVLVVTEFGRTVRVNGTDGTDHGTATCALLVGGAVQGGRVLADWPGLADAALHQGRDLKPTRDLRAVIKGILRDHLGVAERALADNVFPSSSGVTASSGLILPT
jgi:uncharacterized protein (DUF1501 family)